MDTLIEKGGLPSCMGVRVPIWIAWKMEASLEGEGGAFFHWVALQFDRRKKMGTSVEGGGVPSFIGVRSSLDNMKNGNFGRGGRGAFFYCTLVLHN